LVNSAEKLSAKNKQEKAETIPKKKKIVAVSLPPAKNFSAQSSIIDF
jgi:hypothetical protein